MPTRGIVKFWSPARRFGMIAPEDGGPHSHVSATTLAKSGITELNAGDVVEYEAREGERGPWCADVRIVEQEAPVQRTGGRW